MGVWAFNCFLCFFLVWWVCSMSSRFQACPLCLCMKSFVWRMSPLWLSLWSLPWLSLLGSVTVPVMTHSPPQRYTKELKKSSLAWVGRRLVRGWSGILLEKHIFACTWILYGFVPILEQKHWCGQMLILGNETWYAVSFQIHPTVINGGGLRDPCWPFNFFYCCNLALCSEAFLCWNRFKPFSSSVHWREMLIL